MLISGKIIFISPLDWGLGHATRCVPLIQSLSQNNTVIIGITQLNKAFFEQQFPLLQKINVPSYNIYYSKKLPVWLTVLCQVKKIKAVIKSEEKLLEQLIAAHNFDVVISDNRFGLHHNHVESIFITHQLQIKSPVFSKLATKINHSYIHKFDKVWVPDYENKNSRLSGRLSDAAQLKISIEYIGPQSALQNVVVNNTSAHTFDYLLLLSGIEPQRTFLENSLLEKFKDTGHKVLLIRGSDTVFDTSSKNITVINFAFGETLKQLILSATTIICRSGYSTLMDLHVLGKKNLVLIPTPGQTEQEYLANYWREKFLCRVCEQKNISELKL